MTAEQGQAACQQVHRCCAVREQLLACELHGSERIRHVPCTHPMAVADAAAAMRQAVCVPSTLLCPPMSLSAVPSASARWEGPSSGSCASSAASAPSSAVLRSTLPSSRSCTPLMRDSGWGGGGRGEQLGQVVAEQEAGLQDL